MTTSTSHAEPQHKYHYSLVKGVFEQDDEDFLPTADQIQPRLGLKADAWPDVKALNAAAPSGTVYKLVIAGRHGQGYHNVAMAKYGPEAWREKWGLVKGDDEITWGPDPELTPLGIEQARTAHAAWIQYKPPQPDVLFSSPHRRALHTCNITFPTPPASVVVLEDIREKLTGHTCDLRSPVSAVRELFPHFDFSSYEETEDEDPLYGLVETEERVAVRARRALDHIFDNAPDAQVVSITAHAGWIRALFTVTGRYHYQLHTGGIAPLLIKAMKEERCSEQVQRGVGS